MHENPRKGQCSPNAAQCYLQCGTLFTHPAFNNRQDISCILATDTFFHPILLQKIANVQLVSPFWVLKRKCLGELQGLNPGRWTLWLAEGLPEQQGASSCSPRMVLTFPRQAQLWPKSLRASLHPGENIKILRFHLPGPCAICLGYKTPQPTSVSLTKHHCYGRSSACLHKHSQTN